MFIKSTSCSTKKNQELIKKQNAAKSIDDSHINFQSKLSSKRNAVQKRNTMNLNQNLPSNYQNQAIQSKINAIPFNDVKEMSDDEK